MIDKYGCLCVSQEVDVDVDVDLNEHFEDIMEYYKKSGKLCNIPQEKYEEIRDELKYKVISIDTFVERLDDLMRYTKR